MAKMTYRFGSLLILLAIGFWGHLIPNGWSMDKKAYKNISVDRFVKMMDQKDFILINVHIPYQGEIAKTDLMIPFNKIDLHKDQLPNDKDAKILVYCLVGHMGNIAAEKLHSMGYTDVANLQGGMKAWEKSGNKLLFRSK